MTAEAAGICALALLFLAPAAAPAATTTTAVYEAPSSTPLARFAYSTSTDSFFVGGTNVILELSSGDLRVVDRTNTGPKLDSPQCHASGCSEAKKNESRRMTDNVNKILVVDDQNGKLIACGSLFQVR